MAFFITDGVTNWSQVANYSSRLLGDPDVAFLWASCIGHLTQTATRL